MIMVSDTALEKLSITPKTSWRGTQIDLALRTKYNSERWKMMSPYYSNEREFSSVKRTHIEVIQK